MTTHKIPTYVEAMKIVSDVESFRVKHEKVNGVDIAIFNYGLASYSNFLIDGARELRGLTFVKNGNNWVPYIALHKFFNAGEGTENHIDKLRTKKIVSVHDKLDGSMISFVEMPDGTLAVKSKASFVSEQALAASAVVSRESYDKTISHMLHNNQMPIFEYTSLENQIVIEYDNHALTLLQIRDMKTGKYLDIYEYSHIFNLPNKFPTHNLDYWLERAKSKQGIEGWIICFDDGTIVKLKTDWYKARHGLVSDIQSSIPAIVKSVLYGTIDDFYTYVTGKKYEFVELIEKATLNKFNDIRAKFVHLNIRALTIKDRGEFAREYSRYEAFGAFMSVYTENEYLGEDTIDDLTIKLITNKTKKSTRAKEFLKLGE